MSVMSNAYIACEDRGIDPEANNALDRLWWALAQEDMALFAATFPYALSVDIDETAKRIEAAWCAECGTEDGPFIFERETEVCTECHAALNECEGHESLDGAHMGVTVYCDGSCRRRRAVR